MRLFHSFLAGRVRETGKVEILAETWSLAPGADASAVVAAHKRLNEDGACRAPFSHAIFIVDNAVRAAYEFPDPKDSERERLAKQIALAQSDIVAATAAEAEAEAAKASLKDAKANRQAAEARLRELQAKLKELAPVAPPVTASKPGKPEPSIDEQLAALDDEQLLKTAIELKLEVPAEAGREAIVALITNAIEKTPV